MPIQFVKKPKAVFDVATHRLIGPAKKLPPPTIGKMPIAELHKQTMDAVKKKIPLGKLHQAIDKHPDITDKPRAKSIAAATYKIMGKGR